MAEFNLGNVVGLVRSPNPPLEEDGVTEKRYLIWAKENAPNVYELMYYNFQTSAWEPIVQVIPANVSFGRWNITKNPANTNLLIAEAGDMLEGFFNSSRFIKAIYLGGGTGDINNFNIMDEIDLTP